jgi:hypothetical protein
MKRHHHFIFHTTFLTLFGLIIIGLGLLWYYSVEQKYIALAKEIMTPREYLTLQAEAYDLNPELLHRIVECESKWKMVQNKKSSAFGYFQILDRTERSTPQYKAGYSKTDPYVNIDMGVYLFSRYGSQPWNESKPCWWWYE